MVAQGLLRSERPTIRVHCHDRVSEEQLAELLLGIEEEGVPYQVSSHAELNPLDLAHQAALDSRLGVGIGISLNYAVVTLEKLPKERPYIASFWNENAEADRLFGSNAARIVKRTPLRQINERNQ